MARLEVGLVARPHGLTGHVVVELWTNRPERLDAGSVLTASWEDARPDRELRVVSATPHHGRWIVAFDGVVGREGAEQLRDAVLTAEPLDEPDALWVHELIGAELRDTGGRQWGRVVAVEANPASDLLVLEGGGLVPLRFVVGREPGVVVAELPEGLLD